MNERQEPLRPSQRGGRFRMTPRDMDRADVTVEQWEAAQRVSLSIFTDMSNNGFSLRETLASIYVSGLQHAVSVLSET